LPGDPTKIFQAAQGMLTRSTGKWPRTLKFETLRAQRDCFLGPFILKTREIYHLAPTECYSQLSPDKAMLM